MRILSPTMVADLLRDDAQEIYLPCLQITAGTTYRLTNNTQPVVRSDGTYQPYAFTAFIPEDSDAASISVQLEVENIEREVLKAIRTYNGVPSVKFFVVRASAPNTVEAGPWDFVLIDAKYDMLKISGTLSYKRNFLDRAFPCSSYLPSNSAGLFPHA